MKACRGCGQEKPETEFYFIQRTQKLNTLCKVCHGAKGRAWKEANAEKAKAKNREWQLANPDRVKAAQERWKASNPGVAAQRTREWRERNLEHAKAMVERNRQALRDRVFAAYGGYRCACCGETEPMFLSLDHINNDGAEHRRSIGQNGRGGMKVYQWIARNGFPDGFQVLCMNCNCGKARNGGVCPHQRSEGSTTRA